MCENNLLYDKDFKFINSTFKIINSSYFFVIYKSICLFDSRVSNDKTMSDKILAKDNAAWQMKQEN